MCGMDDGSVCAAHSNLLEHGRGVGHKASDAATASLCHACHAAYDSGTRMSKDEKRLFILTAIVRTYIRFVEDGKLVIAGK